MKIRMFQDKDARRCYNIIKKTMTTINKDEDSAYTIERLVKDSFPTKLIEKNKTNRRFYVAVEDEKVLGIGGYGPEDAHFHAFFVDPKYLGKGIGKKIAKRCEKALKKLGYKKVFANSSLYAENFYKKLGFKKNKRMTVHFYKSKITKTCCSELCRLKFRSFTLLALTSGFSECFVAAHPSYKYAGFRLNCNITFIEMEKKI